MIAVITTLPSMLSGTMSLAWVPFLQPLPMDRYWLVLILPLLLAISVVWKTVKLDDVSQVPRQAASLVVQFLVGMAIVAAVLWLATEWV